MFKEVPVDRSVARNDIVQGLWVDFAGKPCRGDGDDAFDVDVVRVQEQTDLQSDYVGTGLCLRLEMGFTNDSASSGSLSISVYGGG